MNTIEGHRKIIFLIRGAAKTVLSILIFLLIPLAAFSLLTSKTTIVPGIKSFIVMSGSMEPTLPVGSMVYTEKEGTYYKGDIISFKNKDGETITHRIIAMSGKGALAQFTTLGDANNSPDSDKISYASVIGKSFFVMPEVGKIILYIKTPIGFVTLLIVPILIFMLYEFLNLKKEMEKEIERKILSRLQQ